MSRKLPAKIDDWPEYWRDLYEERAGIMEYDAHMDKVEAERKAEEVTRELFDLRIFQK